MARVSQWNWSDFTQEWSQTAAINELDEELAAERSARFRQARQLEATQHEFKQGLKQVGSQIDSVSDRIEAVLDWTELRFQQVEFDEYQARKEIRNLVRALAEGRPSRLPGFDDVPGYWLPAAAAAVLPLVLRDRDAIPAQRTAPNPFADLKTGLEAARERDAIRAELFNLAVGRCFDQPVLIDAAVLRLLAEPADLGLTEPGRVTGGWRTLWERTALGDFGDGAAAQLRALLRERFDPEAADEDEIAAWDSAITSFGATDDHRPTQAETFAALTAHFAAEGADAAPADAPDGDLAWRYYLQELIEEPSAAELPLVREMAALDPSSDAPQGSRSWTEPVGTVTSLLHRDLFDPEAPVPLRRLALDLAAPLLRSRLDHLESALGNTETVVITIKRRGASVDVTRDGHDPEQFADVERRIGMAFDVAEPSTPVTAAIAGGIGALAVLMLVIGQWFLAGLCAAAALIPLGKHRSDAAKAAKAQAQRDDRVAEVRAALVEARKEAESEERAETERGIATRQALERLRESLPAEHRPGGLL